MNEKQIMEQSADRDEMERSSQSERDALVPAPAGNLRVYQQITGQVTTSYDLTTDAGKRAAYRARIGRDWTRASVKQTHFPVEHVMMFGREAPPDGEGEVKEYIATVLISPDGQRLALGSKGVVESVYALAAQFGPPPWSPPIIIRVHAEINEKGHSWVTLDLV